MDNGGCTQSTDGSLKLRRQAALSLLSRLTKRRDDGRNVPRMRGRSAVLQQRGNTTMTLPRPAILFTAATLLSLGLGGCGEPFKDGDNSDAVAQVEESEVPPPDGLESGGSSTPALTLASGPDVCFREIAKKFGSDVKVSEITSFFSPGEAIDGRSSEPRGQMTSCSVSYQNPADPRKLLTARFNTGTGTFGEPSPVEIHLMGGNAADFRLADYVIPLSRVNAAALTGVMNAQEKRLKTVYDEYAWSGVRLSGPGAFSSTHTLRLDLDGRLAANDIKDSGYASVSLDGKRVTADHLMP